MLELLVKKLSFGWQILGGLEGVAGVVLITSDLEDTGIWDGVFGATGLSIGALNSTRALSVPSVLKFWRLVQIDAF